MRKLKKRLISGYTLIEILIVLLIISIVTTVALLSISQNQNRRVQAIANEFAQMMTLAEEQAMLQPEVLGVSFSPQSWQFNRLKPDEKQKSVWMPLSDSSLSSRDIPDDMEISLVMAGEKIEASDAAMKRVPQIMISTNGDVTPFTFYIGKKGSKPLYVVHASADGTITTRKQVS